MNIQISIKAEKKDAILEEAMESISQAAKEKPQWEKDKIYDCYKTECDVSEKDIMPVFNELIKKYPNLDIFAVYSQNIREDDTSAQWWSTTKIKTEHNPEGTTLSIDSGTYWF